jgi:hypothetical protein
MEASESVTAHDLYGKPITVGSTVRYIITRTLGKVVDIKKENDHDWALIDSTRLYYDTQYLEVAASKDALQEEEDSVRIDINEVERKIKAMEDMLKVKDVQNDNSCEGGG